MTSEWRTIRAADFIDFNPRLSLKKGDIATKVAMDKLKPFTKKIPETEKAEFNGGAKFCNGDTVMARITPCLENGKTAYVDMLDDGEIGFGSTEFIVMRAKKGISDPQFVYYTAINPVFRNVAIKSMVGSSGRQRVQQSVLEELELSVPDLDEQRRIGDFLARIDEKIALNDRINDNLQQQAQAIYSSMFIDNPDPAWSHGHLSDLITVKYGKDHKKLADGIYPVYGSGGIMRYVERPLYNKESVLIPRKGTLNNVMYVNQPFWSVDTMFYTEMKLPNVAKFVYHFVKAKDLVSMNAGSAVPSMTTDILNAMEVVIPSASALEEFESLVAPMYEAMEANDVQSKALSQMRDTLLPKLMSGEIDVSAVQL
jgi:type I restriction enzyme S subunit